MEPIQCYAFTMGHVIDIRQSADKLQEPGRYLLYENEHQSLRVSCPTSSKNPPKPVPEFRKEYYQC